MSPPRILIVWFILLSVLTLVSIGVLITPMFQVDERRTWPMPSPVP